MIPVIPIHIPGAIPRYLERQAGGVHYFFAECSKYRILINWNFLQAAGNLAATPYAEANGHNGNQQPKTHRDHSLKRQRWLWRGTQQHSAEFGRELHYSRLLA